MILSFVEAKVGWGRVGKLANSRGQIRHLREKQLRKGFGRAHTKTLPINFSEIFYI